MGDIPRAEVSISGEDLGLQEEGRGAGIQRGCPPGPQPRCYAQRSCCLSLAHGE